MISRRRALELLICPVLTTFGGCATHLARNEETCGISADPLERSLCRQREIRASFEGHVSVGSLVGATLGLAIALKFRVNPFLGLAAGAGVGALTAATERYISLKLEEANSNDILMMRLVRKDIDVDAWRANASVSDLKETQKYVQANVVRLTTDIRAVSLELTKVHQVMKEIQLNQQTYSLASSIYENVLKKLPELEKTDLSKVQAMRNNSEEMQKASSDWIRMLSGAGLMR